jgi:hypothetical protein
VKKQQSPRSRSGSKEFRARVAVEFSFLIDDFAFHEERVRLKNQFSVSYVNATTRIIIEGINWGGRARVALGRAGAINEFDNFDLLDVASLRCPDTTPPDAIHPVNQHSHLRALASLLRDCGAEVLRGDFTLGPQIRELQQRRLG